MPPRLLTDIIQLSREFAWLRIRGPSWREAQLSSGHHACEDLSAVAISHNKLGEPADRLTPEPRHSGER